MSCQILTYFWSIWSYSFCRVIAIRHAQGAVWEYHFVFCAKMLYVPFRVFMSENFALSARPVLPTFMQHILTWKVCYFR